jgi:hypothetical protein
MCKSSFSFAMRVLATPLRKRLSISLSLSLSRVLIYRFKNNMISILYAYFCNFYNFS